MDILTQLNRAMAYIEEHIDDDLSLTEVSVVTVYSPYHFGRLFYYIADMPLSEYIRKRKLSLAAMQLQNSETKIIDLAVMYGYDSTDSFSRAFARQHGVTPSQARKAGVNLTIFPPLTFQIQMKGVQAMNWRIEEKEAFEVFGIERCFRNDESSIVPDFWTEIYRAGQYQKLFRDAGGAGDPDAEVPGVSIVNAVCGYQQQDSDHFMYMICAIAGKGCRTGGYKIVQIPKAVWAVFRGEPNDHPGKQIGELFSRAYSEWLPTSGYERVPGPDLEIYNITDNRKYCDEVWIPVIKSI